MQQNPIAQINRQLLANRFFLLDDALFDLFHLHEYKNIQRIYPAYIKAFEKAWSTFVTRHPVFDTRYAKHTNVLLCVYLFPIQQVLPDIKIFNHSHLTITMNHYVEERIKGHFSDRCHIHFTNHLEEADLIIGTHTLDTPVAKPQQTVIIDASLSACDISRIESILNGLIATKAALALNTADRTKARHHTVE